MHKVLAVILALLSPAFSKPLPKPPPLAPGLTARFIPQTATTPASIELDWVNNPASNPSGVVTQENDIGFSPISGGPYTTIGSVAATAATFTDTNLQPGNYFFTVSALSTAGLSARSNEAMAVVPQGPVTLPKPVASWLTDGTVNDTSGNGNSLTAGGTAPAAIAGPGSCVGLNFGGSGYLSANPASFNLGSDFTIATWINAANFTGAPEIFSKSLVANWNPGAKQFALSAPGATPGANSSGFPFLDAYGVGTSTASAALVPGTWAHVIATFTKSSGQVAFYINGVPSGTGTLALGADAAGEVVRIGARADGVGFLNGSLAGMDFYNVALSASQASVEASTVCSGSPPPVNISVTIAPQSVALTTGAQQQFTDQVLGTTTNTGVTWSATLGTITTGGFYTAPPNSGNDTVTVTSVADPTKSASAVVTVTAPVIPPPTITLPVLGIPTCTLATPPNVYQCSGSYSYTVTVK